MSKGYQVATRDGIIHNIIMEARPELQRREERCRAEAKRVPHHMSSRLDADNAVGITIKAIMVELKRVPHTGVVCPSRFTENQVRGSVRRLEEAGKVEDVSTSWSKASVYASADEVRRAKEARARIRRKELVEEYGSFNVAVTVAGNMVGKLDTHIQARAKACTQLEDVDTFIWDVVKAAKRLGLDLDPEEVTRKARSV